MQTIEVKSQYPPVELKRLKDITLDDMILYRGRELTLKDAINDARANKRITYIPGEGHEVDPQLISGLKEIAVKYHKENEFLYESAIVNLLEEIEVNELLATT